MMHHRQKDTPPMPNDREINAAFAAATQWLVAAEAHSPDGTELFFAPRKQGLGDREIVDGIFDLRAMIAAAVEAAAGERRKVGPFAQ
jgi:hypothetical protein